MIENIITQNEGKTLEFKENTKSLSKIIQTVIAFSNTAGGVIVIGVKDKNKEVVGITNILKEEERIANAIADSIEPLLTPNIQLCTWRQRDLLVIHVPYSIGPYYLKSKGYRVGTFIRFGSTNRVADQKTLDTINRSKDRLFYDELPCHKAKNSLNFNFIRDVFAQASKKFTPQNAKSMDIIVSHQGCDLPSNGGLLLFGTPEKKSQIFPSAMIRCARFKGKSKVNFSDQLDIHDPLPLAVDIALDFIKKHTTVGFEITSSRRKEIFQYPPQVTREAVVNAIVHADYSTKGSSIQVSIFDDRIEITNPGALPFGLSLQTAISGFSQLRNKVIGHVFRELNLIEHWGTGLSRMIEVCREQGIIEPQFEEMDNYFKVTLYQRTKPASSTEKWEALIIGHLNKHEKITAKQAQKLWNVSSRTTSTRLKQMSVKGLISEISTGPYDPFKIFVLPKK